MLRHFLFIAILFFSINGLAQQVIVKGNAKSYAGDVLRINAYEDQISFKEKELANCKVDDLGNFQFKFELKETLMSLIHLNVFKGILYIEPGKEYQIVLPQKVNKLPEDELNPFFEETEFYVTILNRGEKELNQMIEKFDKQYDDYLNKYFYLFKGRLDKSKVDSIITALNQNFEGTENQFFKDYSLYSYQSLRLMAYERNKEKIIENVFYKKPIQYQNPAYMDLFNMIFSNYLSYYSQTKHGEKIPLYLIKEKSLKNIKKALSDNAILVDDNLQDLIIAKSLFDNFYKDDYPKDAIIFMLDSLKTAAKSKINRIIANNIFEKITSLLVSYPAPDFDLPDRHNKLQSISGYKGKFIYLNFVNPKSYTSVQELEMLKEMAARNYEMLEIVTICVCSSLEEMQKLINQKSYNWQFLYYSNNYGLLKNYNVRTFPTYYLINPEGKMVMSPAFPPTEATFEPRYADMLKAWKKEMEERKKKKGIQR